ncbi:MAG: acyl-CoA dehydrogenase family protein [Pseudomonadota bacterium]
MTLYTSTSSWKLDEHEMITDTARKFFGAELIPNFDRFRDQGMVDRGFWNKAGAAGLIGGAIEEDFGGSGGPMSFEGTTLYELALTGDGGWGMGVQAIVMHYLRAFGSDEQKAKWLPKMVTGEVVGAIAMTEPGTGSDLQSIRTRAEKDGNSYKINGNKMFITNGCLADLIIVVCKTDTRPDAGAKGISLILVEPDQADGFSRSQPLKKAGLKSSDTAELTFQDVKVPLTNLLGTDEGRGFYQLMQQLPWERLIIAIGALGAIDKAIELTTGYVQQRKAFGSRVMDFQNTRFKLAECKTKAEMLRSFIDRGLALADAGKLDAVTASMAKYWGTEIQNEVVHECLQLHGGYGFMDEYLISRMYADARVQMIYGGANEIMKEMIARSMDV